MFSSLANPESSSLLSDTSTSVQMQSTSGQEYKSGKTILKISSLNVIQ